jgi:hypothetical protein
MPHTPSASPPPRLPSPQAVELKATQVHHVGTCDASSYPMAKKKQSMEFLREKAHLRPRTNTIGAVARIRNALAFATHKFFNDNGFYYVHTPIITASDCEGAGEMFQVGRLCVGGRGGCTVAQLYIWSHKCQQPGGGHLQCAISYAACDKLWLSISRRATTWLQRGVLFLANPCSRAHTLLPPPPTHTHHNSCVTTPR